MTEVELKLAIPMDARDALARPQVLGEPAKVEPLLATYFDTTSRVLAKNGVSLRIRREGEALIQTIKSDGSSSSGLFSRSEQERVADSMVPSLGDTPQVAELLAGKSAKLRPLFTIEVERTSWLIDEGECAIEVVHDLGSARAGDRQSDFGEIELELRSGTIACLFALATRLDRTVPIRLGVLTKADRGWMLLKSEPQSFKAEKLQLDPGILASAAFQRICQSCIRQFRLNEDLLLKTQGSEALHQARVAIRRLRSAFTAFRELVAGDARAADLKVELRWLASELGAARDIDVLLEMVQSEQV